MSDFSIWVYFVAINIWPIDQQFRIKKKSTTELVLVFFFLKKSWTIYAFTVEHSITCLENVEFQLQIGEL